MSRGAPADGDAVPDGTTLLRLPVPPPDFIPDRWKPSDKQFEPSSDDKSRAKAKGTRVRVSAWDQARTTIDQGRSFRPRDAIVLTVTTADLADVAAESGSTLAAVYEPLDAPESSRPGAAGHAGIEGLDRAGRPRPQWRALLQAVADRAIVLDGPGSA